MQFIVIKNDGVSRCRLMKHKEDGTYSFVNLTKDHICPCRFRDMGEAIQELDGKRERGEIECYVEQDYEAKAVKSYLTAVVSDSMIQQDLLFTPSYSGTGNL